MSNAAADRPNQSWHAAGYALNARFVADLGAAVLELLDPKAGERILDLGCGDGALTEKLIAAGAAVIGVDASADMIAAARARGIDARVMDGEALTFAAEFDAVFSNAAMHWMRQPQLVIAGVRRALRPGGRFVGEFGGFGNVAALRTAMWAVVGHRGIDAAKLDPWYYPTPEEYGELLGAAGFLVERIGLIQRPTPLPTGMRGWLATFGDSFLKALPEADRESARDEVVELLRPSLCDFKGRWIADYVRIRFAAHLKR